MNANWIKIRTNLYLDPDVMKLSELLGTDDAHTVGLLVIFWSWADGQTTDGTGIAISSARLDRLVGRPGFAEAVRQIGWLSGRDGNLQLPRYERHNGNTAKARVLESEAKRIRRRKSDDTSDKCRTPVRQNVRPDKIREDKNEEREERALAADDPLPAMVNSLSPAWGRVPGFTSTERKLLDGNRAALESIGPDDWAVMREFLAARLPEGSASWQPRSRAKFLEHPTDVLSHATGWHQKKPKPKPAPAPVQAPGPPFYTKEELAHLLCINGIQAVLPAT